MGMVDSVRAIGPSCRLCGEAILRSQSYSQRHGGHVRPDGTIYEWDEYEHTDCRFDADQETWPLPDHISGRLSDLRRARAWTYGDIAREIGVAKNTASNWENVSVPSPEHALALAKLYGVDSYWLWNGVANPATENPYQERLAEVEAQNIDLAAALQESQREMQELRRRIKSVFAAYDRESKQYLALRGKFKTFLDAL